MKDQKKAGVIIQYINVAFNMFIGIFFTPFLIKSLGDAEYGVYRIVQSFAGQLSIMAFGINSLVTRNIVKYNTLNKKKEKENFLAMATIITVILVTLVLIIGFILSLGIDTLFDKSLTVDELLLARKLYWFLIFNICVTIMTDMVSGIVNGHEKFIVKNGVVTARYVFRVLTLIVLLKLGFGAVAIVGTDLALSVFVFLVNYIYGKFKLKEKIKFYYLDKQELKVSLSYSFAILLQAIVNQLNQNLSSVILGAMVAPEIVTVYSVALTLFTMFTSVTNVLGSVFMPQATRLIMNNTDGERLTDFAIKPSRLQFMMGALVVSGFILFGKEFIYCWVGDGYSGAYRVAIVLMLPAIIPLIQQITTAILNAMLKRLGSSIILICMAIINLGVSIILIKIFGYIGAAYGTAISYIVGYGILINIYLHKVTNLNLKRMYKEIFSKIWIVAIICMIAFIPLTKLKTTSLFVLLFKIGIYAIVFMVAMYLFAMRDYERELIKNPIKKILKKSRV